MVWPPRYMAGDRPPASTGPGEHHLGVDTLLLQVGEAAAVGVGGEHPVLAVAGQPRRGGAGVDAHAGQPACGHGADGVGVVDLARVHPPNMGMATDERSPKAATASRWAGST